MIIMRILNFEVIPGMEIIQKMQNVEWNKKMCKKWNKNSVSFILLLVWDLLNILANLLFYLENFLFILNRRIGFILIWMKQKKNRYASFIVPRSKSMEQQNKVFSSKER